MLTGWKRATLTALLDAWSVFILSAAFYRISTGVKLSMWDAFVMGFLCCFAIKLAATSGPRV